YRSHLYPSLLFSFYFLSSTRHLHSFPTRRSSDLLGVVVSAPESSAVLTSIANLEQRGIPAAWLTSAGAGGADPLGVFAGAALRTQHMLLGTAITQTFPRHPIAVAQQVQVLAQLAPERFRLGLGTSGRAGMAQRS